MIAGPRSAFLGTVNAFVSRCPFPSRVGVPVPHNGNNGRSVTAGSLALGVDMTPPVYLLRIVNMGLRVCFWQMVSVVVVR